MTKDELQTWMTKEMLDVLLHPKLTSEQAVVAQLLVAFEALRLGGTSYEEMKRRILAGEFNPTLTMEIT